MDVRPRRSMNTKLSLDPSVLAARFKRNATIIVATLMITTIPSAALFAYYANNANQRQLYIPAIMLAATFFFDILPLNLIRRGQKNLAMLLVMSVFIIDVLSVPFVVQGLGVIIGVSIVLVVLAIVGLTLEPQYTTWGLIAAFIFALIAIALDFSLGTDRAQVSGLAIYTPYIVALILIPIVIVFAREFNRFSLQAKVTLGILLTGGVTVAVLVYFGFNRATFIGNFLTRKYTNSATASTERRITDVIDARANEADSIFSQSVDDLQNMAKFLSGIQSQSAAFSEGAYWNAKDKVFQLPNGQYGNAKTDPAAIFIPNTYPLNDELIAELNKSIYLDFLAPGFLESHEDVAAVYYISKLGYTVYYPNTNLAEMIPPDFDPTTQAFFTIANPANDPDKLPRWTDPYEDPAGEGLIVTLSIPVYKGNTFQGVLGADIQLARVAQSVADIQLGEKGIPFLIDKNGLLLVMPERGYEYFGLQPEVVPMNESPKLNMKNVEDTHARDSIERILAGQPQPVLNKVFVNNTNTYVAASDLPTTGYKLVVFAPVSDLTQDIAATQTEINNTLTSTLRGAILLLASLFIGAFLASVLVGQIITRPMKRLTNTVEEVTSGNLASRAKVETEDETGILARSFNEMADRLTETLQGLETRIAERTQELEVISQTNARRASLFEAIARISRTISSARNVDQLLPQITETISSQLGYYHVGIFLVDVHHEYAILVAANSEGGKRMLIRNHRLRIGETGLVGFATQTGKPRVALDVGQDAVFFNNPDLPETHSEIALPLFRGSEIIGALDVQSKNTNAFTQEDENILSVLADQVSIAIQNARSFQQSREALEQAERAAAQLGERQWSEFLTHGNVSGFHFDGVDARPVTTNDQTQGNSLAVPLILRGVRIGTLKLSTPDPNRKWDANEIAMVEATAERAAFAIENARLLQEAQKRAAKERTIGEISAKIGNLVNIENIVQTTIKELGSTLSNTDVVIQFNSGQSSRENGSGDNHA